MIFSDTSTHPEVTNQTLKWNVQIMNEFGLMKKMQENPQILFAKLIAGLTPEMTNN